MTAGTARAALLAPGLTGALAASVLAASVLVAGPAWAHTRLDRAVPAAHAVVDPVTEEVVLDFTGPVRPQLSTVLVTGPDGSGTAGAPIARGTDVVQPLAPPLAEGAWTVTYRVVAEDGHPVTGTFSFAVAHSAATATSPSPTAVRTSPSADAVVTSTGRPSTTPAPSDGRGTPAGPGSAGASGSTGKQGSTGEQGPTEALGPAELAATSADTDSGRTTAVTGALLLAGLVAAATVLLMRRRRRGA